MQITGRVVSIPLILVVPAHEIQSYKELVSSSGFDLDTQKVGLPDWCFLTVHSFIPYLTFFFFCELVFFIYHTISFFTTLAYIYNPLHIFFSVVVD